MRGRGAGLIALTVVLMAVLGAPTIGGAASASASLTYSLSGTATTTPGGNCLDCLAFSSTTTGGAACTACLPGDPASGSFTLSLPTITRYQSDACRIKTISGALSITWDNGITSTASLAGRFEDGKGILNLTGPFVSNLTQWAYGKAGVKMNNYPYNPCVEKTNPVSVVLVLSK
jgi:hypothetical protein